MKRIIIRDLALSMILVLSLTLGTGCTIITGTDIPPQSNSPTSENATPIDSKWSIQTTQSQAPVLPSITDVVVKVKPSVVAISTEIVTFGLFNRPFTQEGAGSGWIISEDGIIVTNNHVVEGAGSIIVTLDDGRTFPVGMNTVATDPLTDLAVLKISAINLPAISVGDSQEFQVGDWVVAIGNALGEGISATHGIVSRKEVSITVDSAQTLYNLIQTNAAINPGNSGGPLVNMSGEVIGITSAKLSAVGIEGMGYAISVNEAIPIIQQLINTGYVVRPWLGVGLYTVDQFTVQRYNLAVNKGALLVNVTLGSPADEAGLKANDVIVKFEDYEITEVDELINAIHSSEVGQQVEITFWRDKTRNTTYATLLKSPPPS
ncbi:S1C family serine protease [Chloroflexota bacterium]